MPKLRQVAKPKSHPVVFAFVDESKNPKVNPPLLSCTALTVDAKRYDAVRLGILHTLKKEINPKPNHYQRVPELKFSNFLPESTDKRRVEVLSGLVELAVTNRCRVARVSYFITPRLRQSFGDNFRESDLYGLCFFGLRDWFGHLAKKSFVIPVVDLGLSESFRRQANAYSGAEAMMHVMRAFISEKNVSVSNPGRVADASYSDSTHSALIGFVDCIGGLRKITDIERIAPNSKLSAYYRKLRPIAKALDPIFDADEIISLDCDGEIQGPAQFAVPQKKGAKLAPIRKSVRLA